MPEVFVYGTLMSGEANHHLLVDQQFVGAARTRAEFAMVSMDGFPALLDGGDCAITGEVYRIDGAALDRLDRLEDHPRWYLRRKITLESGAEAETYIMPRNQALGRPIIESGDWREYRGRTGEIFSGTGR